MRRAGRHVVSCRLPSEARPDMTDPLELLLLLSWIAAAATVPSVLLQRQGRPNAALAWMFALFAMPPVTLLAWWLFGHSHLKRKRLRRRRALQEIDPLMRDQVGRLPEPESAADRLLAAVTLPAGLQEAIFPPSGGNAATLLLEPGRTYDVWEAAIRRAGHHIHLIYYIWQDDDTGRRFRDLLVERARRGVRVRLLYDGVGSARLPRSFFDPLRQVGGQAECFMPIHFMVRRPMINFRNHRKLLIVDGVVGFIGGINVGDEYLRWQDLGVKIEGPGVDQLQEIFHDDWYFVSRENLTDSGCFGRWVKHVPSAAPDVSCATIASGPDQRFNAIREMLFLAVTQCRQRLWLMTPYLVPDSALVMALRSAAYRGVDVRIMVPAQSDVPLVQRASRAFYPDLVDAGVRVYEYHGMLHAKSLLFDDDLLLIGSANMDTRSFRLNFEASTFLASRRLNRELAAYFDQRLDQCLAVDVDVQRRRSGWERLVDSAAHLLSPLL